jgi:hypothetical protein
MKRKLNVWVALSGAVMVAVFVYGVFVPLA